MDKRQHRKPAAAPTGFWHTVRRGMMVTFTSSAIGLFVYADMVVLDYYRDEVAPVIKVTADYGGILGQYIDKYDRWHAAGRQVQITSMCFSGCTLAVGRIDKDHLCATPHAVFGFHSAYMTDRMGLPHFSAEGTRIMWHSFAPELRKWLAANGWDGEGDTANHPYLLYLEGADVYQFVRKCE